MGQMDVILDPTQTGSEAKYLEAELRARVVGQDEAIERIVKVYQTYLAGLMAPGRPIGCFLFLGPTGSGKTRIVEATAESLAHDPRAVLKIDCAEFQHSHEVSKLIGSPPGYLGHRETHALLSQEMLNQYHTDRMKISFILFDEIEKANESLWNLLLGILDKAILTLGDNRKVDFSRAIIFMTSNLGAAEMSALVSPAYGFGASEQAEQFQRRADKADLSEKVTRTGLAAARKRFTPEFMNRLDNIVTFKPLGEDQLSKILDIELKMLHERIFNASPQESFLFGLTGAAKAVLLSEGTDARYGARHLKRALERLLVQPICNLIATRQVRGGDCIRVDWEGARNRLTFIRQTSGIPCAGMIQPASSAAVARSNTTVKGIPTDGAKTAARSSKVS